MELIVIVSKLNKRTGVPSSFADKTNVVGIVHKGYRFEGQEVSLPAGSSSLGKWYKATGMDPIIYSRKEYLDRKLPKEHDLGTTRLWISRYSIKDCRKVETPRGWADWSIWQFTDKAAIGRNPHLDLNILKDPSLY